MNHSFYFWLTMAGVSLVGFMVDQHWTESLLLWFFFSMAVAAYRIFQERR